MPAVELHHGFVAALVDIVDDRDGLLPDGIAVPSIPVIRMNPPAMRSP
jgi:hypothetical protein